MARRTLLGWLWMGLLAGCATDVGAKGDGMFDPSADDAQIAAAENGADSAQRPTVVGEIANGDTEEASFASGSRYLAWYFDASVGQTIKLTAQGVRPTDLDTVLFLYSATSSGRPSGASLASNDDFGGALSSYLEYPAQEAGRFVAVVREYSRATRGRISLALELTSGGPACGSRGLGPCAGGEFCDFPASAGCGRADAPGVCRTMPDACAEVYAPVCGCDGTTYGNECLAHAAGVSVERSGECGGGCPLTGVPCTPDCPASGRLPGGAPCRRGNFNSTTCTCDPVATRCGGIAGFMCGADQWCDYPDAAMCGAGDQMGDCQARPTACTREARPACGCDNHTYGNACNAHAAGMDVAHEGACEMPPPPPDCRMTGCGAHRWCSYCWGHYACIPDGALC